MSKPETARRLSGSNGRYEYAYKGQTFFVAHIGTSRWTVLDFPVEIEVPGLIQALRLATSYIDNDGVLQLPVPSELLPKESTS
jgi:hypothetical protein